MKILNVKKCSFLTFVFLIIQMVCGPAHAQESGIKKITQSTSVVEQYGIFELEILSDVSYTNPFDSREVAVIAFLKSPAGGDLEVVPAFYAGTKNKWIIRYTPVTTGYFTYFVEIKTPSGSHVSPTRPFEVIPSSADGFVRRSERNPLYLVFDSGKPYFGIGHNIGWVTGNDIAIYRKYFDTMKKNGCNLARIWVNSPWTLKIESELLGSYDLADSAKLDAVIKLAGEYGIYLVLTLDSYGSLMERNSGNWNESKWHENPYNIANAGPCEKPWDFFSDPEAIKYYKDRLRYIVARWSWSPNVLAFELWNEVDVPEKWAREISGYMKHINPHGQLITISLGYPWDNVFKEPEIWNIDTIDIVQRHVYGDKVKDVIGYIISTDKLYAKEFRKPLFIGEFGMDACKNDRYCDREGLGVALHNSLWSSALSGSFAGALNWWWAGYVGAKNMYPHYKALSSFVKDVDWGSENVSFVETSPIVNDIPHNEEITYSDVKIDTIKTWGDIRYKEFCVASNGDITGGIPNYYLHGYLKKDLKVSPVFHLNYPVAGKFKIHVDMVSQGGQLIAFLDDGKVLQANLSTGVKNAAGEDTGEMTIDVDIPKGEHTLHLVNMGEDWIGIKGITLTNYGDKSFADVSVATAKNWGDTRYDEFTIMNNCDIYGGVVNYYLQGFQKNDIKLNPEFHLNYPIDGKFRIHVDKVSDGAQLLGFLDDAKILQSNFPAGPGKGPWKKSNYLKDYDIYQCQYDSVVELDIPKGKHTLNLVNMGKDWIGIKEITLTNYKSRSLVNARVTGLFVGDERILWIQNKAYNWRDVIAGKNPPVIKEAAFDILDVEDGFYDVEWWDTFKGSVISRKSALAADGKMHIKIPVFSKDIACKIKKQ